LQRGWTNKRRCPSALQISQLVALSLSFTAHGLLGATTS